jgi:alpha-beta hydrolase superfamily lysophospholipase
MRIPSIFKDGVLLFATAILTALVVPISRADGTSEAGSKHVRAVQTIPIEFQTDNGWWYDGRIELPAASVRRPWAVMLLGGGRGGAIDWYMPGFMTLDGKPTRDADTLANALLKRGFVVMRWHAVNRDDPLYAKDQFMMNPGPLGHSVEQARLAMAAFRAKQVVPDNHIFLLGHSLGAARAVMLIDEYKDAPGIVMLAGAALIPSKLDIVRKLVAEARAAADPTEKIAADARHEAMVRLLGVHRNDWRVTDDDGKTKLSAPWAADVLRAQRTPTLLVVGAEDERWLLESYLITDHFRRVDHPDYTWRVYQGLGHQLAPEEAADVTYGDYGVIAKSRTGPIDERVVREVVEWIDHRAK